MVLKSPVLIWLAKLLERLIYKNAWKIIALSPGIKSGIMKIYEREEVHMIPNMADVDFYNTEQIATRQKKKITI